MRFVNYINVGYIEPNWSYYKDKNWEEFFRKHLPYQYYEVFVCVKKPNKDLNMQSCNWFRNTIFNKIE